jgi:hypothetical protein
MMFGDVVVGSRNVRELRPHVRLVPRGHACGGEHVEIAKLLEGGQGPRQRGPELRVRSTVEQVGQVPAGCAVSIDRRLQ